MAAVDLHFYMPESYLPAVLPNIVQIDASTDVLKEKDDQRVVRIAPHFVIKYGRRVALEEGHTMMYVQNVVQIPSPTVYAVFCDKETEKNYIIMQNIPGSTLEDLWSTLSQSQKHQVCTFIMQYVRKMRETPPLDRYCSLGGGPLRHEFFRTDCSTRWMYHGPFRTEHAFNFFIFQTHLGYKREDFQHCKAEFLADQASAFLQQHPSVLTHGDLRRDNIQVQFRPDRMTIESVTFLDWESAGWYPSYWEYVMMLRGCKYFLDDWLGHVNQMLQKYPQEWLWMKAIMELKW